MKYLQKIVYTLMAGMALCSCHNYYKATTLTQPGAGTAAAKLDSLRSANRYLILRNGTNDAFAVTALRVSEDKTSATLSLEPIGEPHRYYLSGKGQLPRYKKKKAEQAQVVNEAHVYVPYDPDMKTGNYSLPLDHIQRIETLQHDAKRSTNSHVLGSLGIVAGGLALTVIIVFLSIPFD